MAKDKMKKILIIDDDKELCETIFDYLMDEFDVILAHTGEQGQKLAFKERPDAIVLDVLLPKSSGFEVCKKLKDTPETKKIPILILSRLSTGKDVERGMKRDADDYLPKPFEPSVLKQRIQALLEKKSKSMWKFLKK
jgi:two-component system phosphate regulon response regulator PhoB